MFKTRFFWAVVLVLLLMHYDFLVRALLLPRKVRRAWVEDMPQRSNAARADHNSRLFRLFSHYRDKKGRYGLKRSYANAMGTVCVTWIVVEQGKVTVVDDNTRVLREFPWIRTSCPERLEIGYYTHSNLSRRREFVEDATCSAATGKLYVIRFDDPGAGERHFY
jgi:hypothetical protein